MHRPKQVGVVTDQKSKVVDTSTTTRRSCTSITYETGTLGQIWTPPSSMAVVVCILRRSSATIKAQYSNGLEEVLEVVLL